MKHLHTEIELDATPEAVWATLIDFDSYPTWNPFIVSMAGTPSVGSKLRARIEPPGGRGATFRPIVTAAEPGRRLEWLGKLLVKGLFDGRHRFEIEATSSGTKFIQSEEFTGLLVPLFAKSLDEATRHGFELMNQALKERLEKAAQGSDG